MRTLGKQSTRYFDKRSCMPLSIKQLRTRVVETAQFAEIEKAYFVTIRCSFGKRPRWAQDTVAALVALCRNLLINVHTV